MLQWPTMDEFSKLRTGWAFILSLAAFTLVFAVLAIPGIAKGRILSEGWEVREEAGWEPVSFPRVDTMHSMKALEFRLVLRPGNGERLYIPRPNTQYLEVNWDGVTLFKASNEASPSGNLWNKIHGIDLPQGEEGTLVIRLKGDRIVGLSQPPFLSELASVRLRLDFANFVSNQLLFFAMGALLTSGLLLVIRAMRRREGLSAGALIGIACLGGIIYLFDYIYFEDLGSTTLLFWQKKISYVFGHASALCYALGAEKFLTGGVKRTRYLAVPTALSILILLGSWSPNIFWPALNILNVSLLLDFGYLVFFLLKEDRRRLGLHLPGFFLAFSVIQLLCIMIFKLNFPYVMQYAVAITGVFLGMVTALNPAETEGKGARAQNASVRDALTGLPDRFWLDRVHMRGPGSLVAIGVTGFSSYVLKEGQDAGDRTILGLANILKAHLRRTDVIVRMEGDVFIVVMEGVMEEGATRALARVADDFALLHDKARMRLCFSISPLGSNAADTADEAIRRLSPPGDPDPTPTGL